MMEPGDSEAVLLGVNEKLLASLVDLTDEKRRELLRVHQKLRTPGTVERLADEVVRLIRVNLQEAEELAETTLWLAEELDDEYCRGRGRRAAANVAHFKGEHETAATLYEAALNSFERLGNEIEAAITRSSALRNIVFIGDYQKAFNWAASAREIFRRRKDDLRLARLELNVATILFRQDRWEEAAERYEQAYEVFRRVGESQDVAISLRNIAVCHVSLNNSRLALEFYRQARDFCRENELPLLVDEIDYNIAYLYYLRGDYTRAIELYQLTRVRCEEIGERYHMALCDLDQAEIFLELNLVEEAVDLAQRAFASFDKLGMPYETAKALTNLAIAVNRQGKTFLTIELLSKARNIFVEEQNRVWPALIDLYKAIVLYGAGRLLDALRLAHSAREGFTAASLPTKKAIAEILLARLHLEISDIAKARKYCISALADPKLPEDPALRYQGYFVLGQVEEAAGDKRAALQAYRESQNELERLRSHLQIDEVKIGFIKDKLLVYESLVSLLIEEGATAVSTRAVFDCIEKAKTRSLADLMAFRAHALPSTSAARSDQAKLVRELREELNWYYRQIDLQEMRDDRKSREEVIQLRKHSRRQEDHLVGTLQELQASDKEFSSLQEAATVELEAIRSVVSRDTLLVEYYIARGIVYACVLSSDSIEIVPLTVSSRVRELLRLFQVQLSKFSLDFESNKEFMEVSSEATKDSLVGLSQELIAPLESLLNARRLVFIPHGFLYYVPFQCLSVGRQGLVDRFEISYAPSASAYFLCSTKKASSKNKSLILSAGLEESEDYGEAVLLAEILPNSCLLVGKEASLSGLRAQGLGNRFIYIASRSHFRQDNPMFSAIELGGSDVSLFDLYNLKLDAEVVLLNGCGLAAGETGSGDELVGLTRGLFYAGAESVVMNLWEGDRMSSALLLRSFVENTIEGYSRVEALRRAYLRVREEYPHPYYWAPFVLVGKSA